MQLDKTQIAVRERGLLEILDLSLHVVRGYAKPLMATLALGAAPLMLLNYLLLGWMIHEVRFDEPLTSAEVGSLVRYVWIMSLLVFIEAPLMSGFATSFLGQAVFLERPRSRDVVRDVLRLFPQFAWCQVMLRGAGPAWLLVLTLERELETTGVVELLFLPCLALYVALLRALRPYLNEIILLERNPLRARRDGDMTIGRRSMLLHSPSSADLVFRWIGFSMIAWLLVLATWGVFLFLSGVLLNDWSLGPFMFLFALPMSMWIVAAFAAVARFLGYLDLRIRHEGWEVELHLRAEAARVEQRFASTLQ